MVLLSYITAESGGLSHSPESGGTYPPVPPAPTPMPTGNGKDGGEGKRREGRGGTGREGRGGRPGMPKSRVGKPRHNRNSDCKAVSKQRVSDQFEYNKIS